MVQGGLPSETGNRTGSRKIRRTSLAEAELCYMVTAQSTYCTARLIKLKLWFKMFDLTYNIAVVRYKNSPAKIHTQYFLLLRDNNITPYVGVENILNNE